MDTGWLRAIGFWQCMCWEPLWIASPRGHPRRQYQKDFQKSDVCLSEHAFSPGLDPGEESASPNAKAA